ncbi:hypothetical protein K2173_011056 [Erythroxylum novogranatense]|uniref:Uncharacterized protein n=1 Tax=Erythroxylum novogranatense TaxID=1862640 RepID=A0AAV8T1S2_9ROSI|nr:hypothetical protein K2173_011056 [Erythroxylum novogranatense]
MSTHTSVIAWGSGEDGQLGIGKKDEKERVCVVETLEPYKVHSVVAGSQNSLAICEDRKAAIGGWHCLAVDDEGRAYAWGICGNEYGQCVEEPERKDDIGRPLRRDIVIPQHCAPKLVVRQGHKSYVPNMIKRAGERLV